MIIDGAGIERAERERSVEEGREGGRPRRRGVAHRQTDGPAGRETGRQIRDRQRYSDKRKSRKRAGAGPRV